MPNQYSLSPTSTTVFFRFRAYLLLSLVSFCLVAVPLASAAGVSDVQKARIVASLAENIPMDQIIREAYTAGVSMGDIVTTLLAVGADAQKVVYYSVAFTSSTGNTEGTSQVIRAALAAVGPEAQQSILNTAITGGADVDTASKAATKAGMSPGNIGNALANAGTTSAPVFGYSAPAPTAGPTTFQPSAPPALGGGGGGAPVNPTKPASPTNPNAQRR